MTRNYFENLVRALENGLSDVDSHVDPNGGCSRTVTSKSYGVGGSSNSKGKGGRGKGGASSKSSGSSARSHDDSGHWSCEHCTFANPKSATICPMCHQRR